MTQKDDLQATQGFFSLLIAWIKAHLLVALSLLGLALLVMVLIVMAWDRGEDPLGTSAQNEAQGSESEQGDMAASDAPPTHEELASQNPIPMTEGPWRFFADDSEDRPLYDIQFEPDGTCFVPGDTIVYGGTYTESSDSVEITLFRRTDADAADGEGGTRTETVEWTEWFHMARTGNTMAGEYEGESWRVSYDEGVVMGDVKVIVPAAFARPQRSDDEG